MRPSFWCSVASVALLLAGCAEARKPRDYTLYRAARPVTLLVLPPVNRSVEVRATPAVWAQATRPLAEAGYYVLPATLVDELLRGNGVATAAEAAALPREKLRSVFGADAAIFMRIDEYGTGYQVIDSSTRVSLSARMVDLRTGAELWSGGACAKASSIIGGGGLLGMLAVAVVNQVVQTASDAAFDTAGEATAQLFRVGEERGGLLPGPHAPPPETAAGAGRR